MSANGKKVWEGDVMPIGAYYGPIASYKNEKWDYISKDFLEEQYFQMIAECGVKLITTIDCDYNIEPQNLMKTMEFCERNGIKILVTDSGLKPEMSAKEMQERMKAYSGYESFAGIRVIDEPEVDYFPIKCDGITKQMIRPLENYQELSTKINGIDGVLGYMNLFPYYSWMEPSLEDYQKYVDEYCETCRPKIISFDHYPFDYAEREKAYRTYFANMSLIRETAKRYDVPYWAFIQCGGQWHNARKPSVPYFPLEGEFMWNVNTCLAMGAKGIQYFPLVQPHWFALTPDGLDTKRSGLIAADGSKTPWYEYAKRMNRQIAAVDEVLMNAEHEGVIATGQAKERTVNVQCLMPHNCYRELTSVKTQEAGAVIGCFAYQGKTALYVVNNDMYGAQEITLQLDGVHTVTSITGAHTETSIIDEFVFTPQKGEAVLLLIE